MNLVRLLRRIALTVVGTVILAVGVVLLVAPGPGLLVILLALIVFAVEYDWARRRLVTVRDKARSAADKAAASRVATAAGLPGPAQPSPGGGGRIPASGHQDPGEEIGGAGQWGGRRLAPGRARPG